MLDESSDPSLGECLCGALFALVQSQGGRAVIPLERLPYQRYRLVPVMLEDGSLEITVQILESMH